MVRSGARQKGIGRLLVFRAKDWALSRGCDGIEVTSGIRPERDAAHHFYPRLGFERMAYRYWLPLVDPSIAAAPQREEAPSPGA